MKKKIRFYKALLIEIIETLCTICLFLEREGRYSHNEYSRYMRGHFTDLKAFSEDLREKPKGKKVDISELENPFNDSRFGG